MTVLNIAKEMKKIIDKYINCVFLVIKEKPEHLRSLAKEDSRGVPLKFYYKGISGLFLDN